MSTRLVFGYIVLSVLTTAVSSATTTPLQSATHSETQKAQVVAQYGKLPLRFEANAGQTDKQVKFLSRGSGHSLFLTPKEAVLVLSRKAEPKHPHHQKTTQPANIATSVLRMQLVGANAKPDVKGEEELAGKSNYFIGNDPKRWHANVANYAKVRYHELYPGVDLVYYGNQRQLEYDFVLAPGADPKAIAFHIEGADSIKIDNNGDLVLTTKSGEVRQHKPVVYQEVAGTRREIKCRYRLNGNNEVGFTLARYDHSQRLVIDPVLALGYSTYLGGSDDDNGQGIAVDASGNAYVAGYTSSTNFPTANAYQSSNAGVTDAFVAKFNASGDALIYSTYLGGASSDLAYGIAVDASGNAYVTGDTVSTDFPTANAYQSTLAGSDDAFIAKLNASGSALVYSTYLGGGGYDEADGVAVDASGNAYLAGWTFSIDFPTANAYQSARAGFYDAFITKFGSSGNVLVYSTYLGGSAGDSGSGIGVDTSGNAYVTGSTGSTDFPTANAYQSVKSGSADAFITKFNASGSVLVYSTYLGGSDFDEGDGIAVDTSGNAYVTGYTFSTNFPTANAYQSANAGDYDAFVTKFNASGNTLDYSTYLGGSDVDRGLDIAVDTSGDAFVTGETFSSNFPTLNAYQPEYAGNGDAFVTKLGASGSSLGYSTYLGGSGLAPEISGDSGEGIAVDTTGNAYVAGVTFSTDFPTANAYQSANAGNSDAFVTKFTEATDIVFDDEFTGPTLDPAWQTTLPTNSPTGPSYTYLGAADHTFETIDGASVIRLTNTLSAYQRVGWSAAPPLTLAISSSPTSSRIAYKMRFKTLFVPVAASDLHVIEAMVMDATDQSRYDVAALAVTESGRFLSVGSTISNEQVAIPIDVQDNTWYRLSVEESPVATRAVVLRDDGTELASYTLAHNSTAFSAGTRIGLAQSVAVAATAERLDVAVDYVRAVRLARPISCALPPETGDIVGTPGNDTLFGTPGDDRIYGLGGNDYIDGLGGNDVICGGPGRDRLKGRAGDDYIDGGDGNDDINAGDGRNTVFGGNGDDDIVTGTGDDTVDAGAGADDINTGAGNDVINGGDGVDKINAGDGDDVVNAGAGNDTVIAGPGADTVYGEAGNDHLYAADGVSGNDTVDGGPQHDTCIADPGDVVINCE